MGFSSRVVGRFRYRAGSLDNWTQPSCGIRLGQFLNFGAGAIYRAGISFCHRDFVPFRFRVRFRRFMGPLDGLDRDNFGFNFSTGR